MKNFASELIKNFLKYVYLYEATKNERKKEKN